MTTATRAAGTLQNPSAFLRRILLADTATCVASGMLTSLLTSTVAGLTQIPPAVLLYSGLSLFPIAAFMAVVATRAALPVAGVWLVIIGNVGWVLGSLWLAVGGAISPNGLGMAFILAQATAVAVLAALEYAGVRHMTASRGQ